MSTTPTIKGVPGVVADACVSVCKPITGGSGLLSLEQLWQRARELGLGQQPSESAAIVRADRDARESR